LPGTLVAPFALHLERVRVLLEQALGSGHAGVYLPFALERKYPGALLEWGCSGCSPRHAHAGKRQ